MLVFTRTKHGADRVTRHLVGAGINADAIHGNKSQPQRERALAGFRNGNGRVLVATDIAARGIDVEGVSHVINFELPNVPEDYVHRIGRTARAGASGNAVAFCSDDERPYLRSIEKLTTLGVPVAAMPSALRRGGDYAAAGAATSAGERSTAAVPLQQTARRSANGAAINGAAANGAATGGMAAGRTAGAGRAAKPGAAQIVLAGVPASPVIRRWCCRGTPRRSAAPADGIARGGHTKLRFGVSSARGRRPR